VGEKIASSFFLPLFCWPASRCRVNNPSLLCLAFSPGTMAESKTTGFFGSLVYRFFNEPELNGAAAYEKTKAERRQYLKESHEAAFYQCVLLPRNVPSTC